MAKNTSKLISTNRPLADNKKETVITPAMAQTLETMTNRSFVSKYSDILGQYKKHKIIKIPMDEPSIYGYSDYEYQHKVLHHYTKYFNAKTQLFTKDNGLKFWNYFCLNTQWYPRSESIPLLTSFLKVTQEKDPEQFHHKDNNGNNLFHHLAQNTLLGSDKKLEFFKLLILYKVCPHYYICEKNDKGDTPLDYFYWKTAVVQDVPKALAYVSIIINDSKFDKQYTTDEQCNNLLEFLDRVNLNPAELNKPYQVMLEEKKINNLINRKKEVPQNNNPDLSSLDETEPLVKPILKPKKML